MVRDVAGDAAQNAATRINPSEEQLSQIDSPAADNQWHDVPSVAELRSQAKGAYDKNRPFSKKEAQDAAGNAAQTGVDKPTVTEGETAQTAAAAGTDNLAATAKRNVPDETQEKTKESINATRNQARDYLNKKVPKERREQTIWRLKKMIVEVQGHDDCTSSNLFRSERCDLHIESQIKRQSKPSSTWLRPIASMVWLYLKKGQGQFKVPALMHPCREWKLI